MKNQNNEKIRYVGNHVLCPVDTDWLVAKRDRIRLLMIGPWKKVQAMGVGVHVGEFGAFSKIPHDVVLAWMRELMFLLARI